MIRPMFYILLLSQLAFGVSGCAPLMGGLRRDFDDGDVYAAPTTGGRWAEKGFLSEEESGYDYAAVGHAERSPASEPALGGAPGWNAPQARTNYYGIEDAIPSRTPATAEKRPQYKNGNRATRSDFIDEATNEGSLWAPEGQTNYYFSKNKIRSAGDILTIALDEQVVRDINLEIKRTLTKEEQQTELGIAQLKMKPKRGLDAPLIAIDPSSKNAPPAGAPAKTVAAEKQVTEEEELPVATMKDVDLVGAVEVKANDTLMAEIVERYPNGNYKIRGTKKVIYKNGSPRLLTMVAIARAQDISEEDVINSGKLYEYRLEALR